MAGEAKCLAVVKRKRVPRVVALDLGAARVGVAISDELGEMAHPRGILPGKDVNALLAKLKDLVAEEKITHVLVGLPLDMKGGEGESARKVRQLAQRIADATSCDVELWDERLSTVQARRALADSEVHGRRVREHIDEASAVVLLQAWLDSRRIRHD
jgi:putative Holliday junction resolvase